MTNPNFQKQEKQHLKLSRAISLTILTIIFIVVSVILYINSISFWVIIFIGTAIILVTALEYLYQGAAYKRFAYAMDDYGLYINQGVIWQRKIVIPRNRVQHTDVAQGPLMRKFKLAKLTIHTAGTRNASVQLPGIKHKLAEKLRESLAFEESNDAV